jgi:hypothetical protein
MSKTRRFVQKRGRRHETSHAVIRADCLEWLRMIDDDSVDMVFTSPPYEDCRTYNMDFHLKGQEWVDWAVQWYSQCARICRGLVACVVEGKTRGFRWSATPALLMADLHRAGIRLRKPPVFSRVGIPGSGGPDWWRNDYEFVVCSSKGKLPWSDNTATGGPCKYGPGGPPSHRTTATRGHKGGDTRVIGAVYKPPKRANPGNVIRCNVGGSRMGSELAHENEAPFPESLVEPFVKCFCPLGGVVLDPFAGSGTTAAVAMRLGRNSVSVELRESQIELIERRLSEETNAFRST